MYMLNPPANSNLTVTENDIATVCSHGPAFTSFANQTFNELASYFFSLVVSWHLDRKLVSGLELFPVGFIALDKKTCHFNSGYFLTNVAR